MLWVHLVGLNLEKDEIKEQAEALYKKLQREKVEVLYDDRDLRAGEKFSDADLIGIPVRLTLSKRTAKENKVEFKLRAEKDSELLSAEEVIEKIKAIFQD